MPLGLLGFKVGMTQIYDDKGRIAPVTVLRVGPCPVLQVKDQQRDGYDAVQLGFLDKARRKAARTAAGITPPPKANCEPQRYMREFRLDKASEVQVGAILRAAEVFK